VPELTTDVTDLITLVTFGIIGCLVVFALAYFMAEVVAGFRK
jgi:hypothetical protein